MSDDLPRSPTDMFDLMEAVLKWQQHSGNQPIAVHCM
jgi:hypothetical protein